MHRAVLSIDSIFRVALRTIVPALLIAFSSGLARSDADGIWYPVPMNGTPPPADLGARQGHTIVYDSARDRFLAFGGVYQPGGVRLGDVWERAVGAAGAWTLVTTAGTPPSPRSEHTAVYDPLGDRLLVFGGDDGALRNDVWQLSLAGTPTWSLLVPTGTPPAPRSGHTMVLDAARNRLIVFGGRTPAATNDVWILDLAVSPPAWLAVSPSGTPPNERAGAAAIFDAAHDRMVLYGGFGFPYTFGDVWTLSFSGGPAWVRRAVLSSPEPRDGAAAAFDAANNRMLVLGGRQVGSPVAGFFSIDLTTFAPTALSGTTAQTSRFLAGFALSPTRVIVQGGGIVGTSLPDTWQIVVSPNVIWGLLWPLPAPPSVSRRYGAAGIYDPLRNRFLMVGGGYDAGGSLVGLGDVDELRIGRDSTWQVVTSGAPGFARLAHCGIYDPGRDRIVVFGGYNNGYLADVWQIRLSPSLEISPLAVTGPGPIARDYSASIYDPVRDRMIVYGGNTGSPRADIWALRFDVEPAQWVPISPPGDAPNARMLHGAIYDPYGDRMLTFGGYDGFDHSTNDLWALALGGPPAWTQLLPAGPPPPPRYGYSMVFDPNRQRVVLYGGKNSETGQDFDDVWELPLVGPLAWAQRHPGIGRPPGRYVALGLIDPIHDLLLVSGGAASTGLLADVWRLQWTNETATATEVALLSSEARSDEVVLKWGLSGDAATYARLERRDEANDWRTIESGPVSGSFVTYQDRDVVAGRRYAYRVTAIAGAEMSTSSEVWIDVPAGPRFSLAGFSPNPATRAARVAFSLAGRTPATIEVVDVGGRRVASRTIESPATGTQSIAIAPEGGLSPGLYFVRLTQGGRTLVARGSVMQ